MRKGIAILLSVLLAVAALPFVALPASADGTEYVSGDYVYTVTGGEATITDYYGAGGDIAIPSVLDGYPVTGIGLDAFFYNSSLTSILIPNSITSIDAQAFFDCVNLANVFIPSSVVHIGSYAFHGCKSLNKITLPDSVMEIGFGAFIGTGYFMDESNWLNGVLYIDKYLIVAEDTLTGNYNVKAGTKVICDYAFSGQIALYSISIPDSVIAIGNNAFSDCISLKSAILPESIINIGNAAFFNCPSLASISIPNNVKIIGDKAFYGCSITSITIPKSVEKIGNAAFSSMKLEKIDVDSNNKNYTSINGILFNKQADSIILYPAGKRNTSYSIPNSVINITDYAFSGCSSLISITIPNSVTYIGEAAFSDCSSLNSVTIPNSVTYIGEAAFSGCSSLNSVTIPNSVTYIGEAAFPQDCLLYIFEFSSGHIYALENSLHFYLLSAPKIESILPFGTTFTVTLEEMEGYEYKCGDSAWQTSNVFAGLTANTEYIFYQRIAASNGHAASDSSEGSIITTPKNSSQIPAAPTVEKIDYASITLTSHEGYEYKCGDGTWQTSNIFTGLFDGAEYTFYQRVAETDTNYASEPSPGAIVKTLSRNICSTCMGSGEVSVNGTCYFCSGSGQRVTGKECTVCGSSNVTEYIVGIGGSIGMICNKCGGPGRAIYGTCSYCGGSGHAFQPAPCSDCEGSGVYYEYTVSADGTATITDYHGADSDIAIPSVLDGYLITSIAYQAFYDCDFLTSVIIPGSVTNIGGSAFAGCSHLTSVVIPDGITTINDYTFADCPSLANIDIPKSVTHIGICAFSGCSGLTSIRIPDSLTYIGNGAFYNCNGLQEITGPYVGCEPNMPDDTYFA